MTKDQATLTRRTTAKAGAALVLALALVGCMGGDNSYPLGTYPPYPGAPPTQPRTPGATEVLIGGAAIGAAGLAASQQLQQQQQPVRCFSYVVGGTMTTSCQ